MSIAATAERGSKVSEDTTVPRDRLAEAIEETLAIERRHGLSACRWGPAGDANLHSPFLVAPADGEKLVRAERAAEGLFELAVRLGGSISSEHGVGSVERGLLAGQWSPRALALDAEIKRASESRALLHLGRNT